MAVGRTSMNGFSAGSDDIASPADMVAGRKPPAASRNAGVVVGLEQEAQELLDGLLVAVLLEAEEVVLDAERDADSLPSLARNGDTP